jgi:Ca-activated chloride channel family protein
MKTDDPKFTAHAIGELEDLTPAERAEIEALIEADADAAAEAAETQKLAARLREEMHGEETQPLTAAQRARVLAATQARARVNTPQMLPLSRQSQVLSAIAACLIVGLFVSVIHHMLTRDQAAMRGFATSEQGLSVPMISVEGTSDPIPEPPPAFADLAAAAPEAPKVNSPSIDVISTTASTSSFKVTPPQTTTTTTASNLTFSGTGSVGDTDRSARAGYDATRALAAWEVDKEWARPHRKFNQSVVEIPGASTGQGNLPGTMAGRTGIGRVRGIDVGDRRKDVRFQGGSLWDQPEAGNTNAFDTITDNGFLTVRESPLSTFSIDVDTASYAIVRRFLNEQRLPPKGAVRIEELLNYFTYDYPQPKGDAPFSATMEVAACPWTPAHRLVRIGLKGREIAKDKRPASNLVFLINVSGSMQPAERLPLLKQSLGLLIDQLGEEDRVAMVVYAGASGCVLRPTSDKTEMRLALGRLEAGGSTNGGSGIQLAYDIARKNFIKGGTNRVILGTDGDWNVGITNHNDLFDLIAKEAKSGVFLTALGFGMGNLKDAMLVKLADKGNGNYGYIDTLLEAKKLLVDQIGGTLVTIAKDVKIQVEFNPAQVAGYRLIGYEKRLLAKEDFNDDKKDAGEIGAGHTVTALYEVVPVGKDLPDPAKVDALKYQPPTAKAPATRNEEPATSNQQPATSPELLTLKLRYKAPDGDTSKLLEFPLTDTGATWEKSSGDFRFAAAVAGYGMLLRDSPHKGNATWNSVHELAVEGKGADANGYRAEFISLLEKAQSLGR